MKEIQEIFIIVMSTVQKMSHLLKTFLANFENPYELKRNSKKERIFVYLCIVVSFVSLELQAVNACD